MLLPLHLEVLQYSTAAAAAAAVAAAVSAGVGSCDATSISAAC
jgi:hypothetical protein